jgi:hypothetical protein
MAGDVEEERRRLAAMLPGAEISAAPVGGEGVTFVALVRDLDGPIPVLVERGRYSLAAGAETGEAPGAPLRSRTLDRGRFRLVLVDSREEFAARVSPGGRSS